MDDFLDEGDGRRPDRTQDETRIDPLSRPQPDVSRRNLFHLRIQHDLEAVLLEFSQGKLREGIVLKFGDNSCAPLQKHHPRPIAA